MNFGVTYAAVALFTFITRGVCLPGLGITSVKGNAVGIDRNKMFWASTTLINSASQPIRIGLVLEVVIGISSCDVCRYVTSKKSSSLSISQAAYLAKPLHMGRGGGREGYCLARWREVTI